MTSAFTPGTPVHVEFDAIIEEPHSYDHIKPDSGGLHNSGSYGYGFIKVRDTKNSVYHYVWVSPYLDDHDLVTVIKTPDWETHGGAQVGDVWEVDDHEFFVYQSYGSLTLYPVDGSGLAYFPEHRFDEFGAKNPRLVRRRGEDI